jgi:hypothetical protein
MNSGGFQKSIGTRFGGAKLEKPFLKHSRCGLENFHVAATNEIYHGFTCDEICSGKIVLIRRFFPG